MCGLVGIVSAQGLKTKHQKIFEMMMVANTLRGLDSTGFSTQDLSTGELHSVKKMGNSIEALPIQEYKNLWIRNEHTPMYSLIGHNRAATYGKVDLSNAHPFLCKGKDNTELYFAHNGTLTGYQDFRKDLWNKFSTDSEYLGHCIAEEGFEMALGNITGAAACLWQKGNTQEFYMFHNKDRPLAFMQDAEGTLYIQSTVNVLNMINSVYDIGVDPKEIYILKEDSVCKVFPKKGILYFEMYDLDYSKRDSWRLTFKEATKEEKKGKQKEFSYKNVEWTFIDSEKDVHKGVMTGPASGGRTFLSYYQNGDKTLSRGSRMLCQVLDTDPIGQGKGVNPTFRVTCFLSNEDFKNTFATFYSSNFSKKELEDPDALFEGEIQDILAENKLGTLQVDVTLKNIRRVVGA